MYLNQNYPINDNCFGDNQNNNLDLSFHPSTNSPLYKSNLVSNHLYLWEKENRNILSHLINTEENTLNVQDIYHDNFRPKLDDLIAKNDKNRLYQLENLNEQILPKEDKYAGSIYPEFIPFDEPFQFNPVSVTHQQRIIHEQQSKARPQCYTDGTAKNTRTKCALNRKCSYENQQTKQDENNSRLVEKNLCETNCAFCSLSAQPTHYSSTSEIKRHSAQFQMKLCLKEKTFLSIEGLEAVSLLMFLGFGTTCARLAHDIAYSEVNISKEETLQDEVNSNNTDNLIITDIESPKLIRKNCEEENANLIEDDTGSVGKASYRQSIDRKCSANPRTKCCSPICGLPKSRSSASNLVSISDVEKAYQEPEYDEDINDDPKNPIESPKLPNADERKVRKRRKLPEIPSGKKSFSTASIMALRTPTLAEELHEAESGFDSRCSTPESYSLNKPPKPLLILKCQSYAKDESPESDVRSTCQDFDSGHSTQNSPEDQCYFRRQDTLLTWTHSGDDASYSSLKVVDATHRGLYKFIPRHGDEIEIEVGDPVYVHKEAEDLWCEGLNIRTGRQGIFPSAYVADLEYSEFDPYVQREKKERFFLQYMGSVETQCHKGNQVLCQAIRKIVSTKNSFLSSCIIEICDAGIRMINKSDRSQVNWLSRDYFFNLKDVSFCGFHPKDSRYFGFITKHPSHEKFACHIFYAQESTQPIADSVGRAFQRFYKKYIETAYPIEDIYIEE